MQLMQASHQWAKRPDDERYTSLIEMRDHFQKQRDNSRATVVSSRALAAIPMPDHKGLVLAGENGVGYAPTNWSFGQLAQLAEAPAGYLRTLPSDIAADCINYGLKFKRDIDDVGLLLYKNGGDPVLRAATGPRYGRIWNADVTGQLVERFGDGVSGDWRVPGEFKQRVEVTKANTTLYASDRDMFVFLADEDHRIEIPGRRDGKAGSLARGFFMWNSEVGDTSFGLGTFLFDYACCNRIVWGAEQYTEVRIRHSAGAPDRYIEELVPALQAYAEGSTAPVTKVIADARKARIEGEVDEWLAKRFGAKRAVRIMEVHVAEEHRPVETLWDAATAVTAFARAIPHQNARVDLERKAGEILDLVA